MIYKILKQNNLYHNPDPLFRLVREANESIVIVEGQEARALLDSGSQLSAISLEWVKKLKLKPQQLQSILQIEGSGGLEVPYLGYVEAHLKIPRIKAFDLDILLLIVPDSAHIQYTPITLGTLHIDMAIKLATKKELESLNKQWKRSLMATKLTMKEAQIVGVDDKQITSKIDNILKLANDITIDPFVTIEVKGIIKTPNHYKHVNVVTDSLPGNQCCKDVTVVQQIQVLKPGSNKIPTVLRNLSCRTLKVRKGTKIAHVEASNIVPMMVNQELPKNMLKKEAGNAPKGTLLENIPNTKEERIDKILESLSLQGIETWREQQQQSAKLLIREYQHLFALTLNGLGKTSFIQHDIKLDDETPFKERYQRILPHQYEEVRKHLQEMLNIGAIQ